MASYSYNGIERKTGKEVKGTVNSDSLSQAKSQVKAAGILLTSIKEAKNTAKSKGASGFSFGGSVPVADLALMTRQFSTLISAKIPIVQGIDSLTKQIENPKLSATLSEVKQKVKEGSSLAKAMSDYPKIFDNIYCNMIEAGESSGKLETVLEKLADFTEAQEALKSKVKGAMLYPIIMMVVAGLITSGIFMFILPKIAKILTKKKQKLPKITEICLAISDFLVEYWWGVLIGVIFAYFMFSKYTKTPKGKRNLDKVLLKFPIVGKMTVMINTARFSSTLSTLLQSSVPIVDALKIVKNLVQNEWMKDAIEESIEYVIKGRSMSIPLKESGHFPPMVTNMIALGEKSGEVEEMLEIISRNYDREVETRISSLTGIIEPIMIVMLGGIVAVIVMAVLLPIMDMSKVRR